MTLSTSLSSGQKYLLELVFRDGEKRRALAFKKSGLSRQELRRCERVSKALREDESVRIAINLDLRMRAHTDSIAEAMLRGGRILNKFETGTALENRNEYDMRLRLLKEFRIYGVHRNVEMVLAYLPDDEHPLYGMLDYIGNPLKARGTYYGLYRMILRREFVERATFTPADSFGTESADVFCWEDIAGLLVKQTNPLDPQRWYEYVENNDAPEFSVTLPSYIEAQVFGPIYLSDVEKLYYPCHDMLDTWFMSVLTSLSERYGFVLEHY